MMNSGMPISLEQWRLVYSWLVERPHPADTHYQERSEAGTVMSGRVTFCITAIPPWD